MINSPGKILLHLIFNFGFKLVSRKIFETYLLNAYFCDWSTAFIGSQWLLNHRLPYCRTLKCKISYQFLGYRYPIRRQVKTSFVLVYRPPSQNCLKELMTPSKNYFLFFSDDDDNCIFFPHAFYGVRLQYKGSVWVRVCDDWTGLA